MDLIRTLQRVVPYLRSSKPEDGVTLCLQATIARAISGGLFFCALMEVMPVALDDKISLPILAMHNISKRQ